MSRRLLVAESLEKYNKWRRGADIEHPDPKDLGEDIDRAVSCIKSLVKLERRYNKKAKRVKEQNKKLDELNKKLQNKKEILEETVGMLKAFENFIKADFIPTKESEEYREKLIYFNGEIINKLKIEYNNIGGKNDK